MEQDRDHMLGEEYRKSHGECLVWEFVNLDCPSRSLDASLFIVTCVSLALSHSLYTCIHTCIYMYIYIYIFVRRFVHMAIHMANPRPKHMQRSTGMFRDLAAASEQPTAREAQMWHVGVALSQRQRLHDDKVMIW